ncbi:MAG: hypothetical protein RI973_939 [Bacteroidota bacterium]|jgi:hypothetical protein
MPEMYSNRFAVLCLLAITAIFYYPTLQKGFVNRDDTHFSVAGKHYPASRTFCPVSIAL